MDPNNKSNNGGTPGSVPSQAEGSNGPPAKRQALQLPNQETLRSFFLQYPDELCLEKRYELARKKLISTNTELQKTKDNLKKLEEDHELWGTRFAKYEKEMQLLKMGRDVQRVEENVKMFIPNFYFTEFLSKISALGEKAKKDKDAEERLNNLIKFQV